jgi:DNA ligase-4
MLNSTTMNEQKWLVRVILKDLKIGIGHEVILRSYHKDAVDLYNSTSDLKEVFAQLEELSNHERSGQN